jgi:hypothetical protein
MKSPAVGRRSARALLATGAAALATAFAAAPASAAVTLDWTTENAYASGCTRSLLNCTWLGYVTNSPAPMGANGTATPSDGATGPTVTPRSARGAGQDVTWSFKAVSGALDTAGLSDASLLFDGTVTFASPAPPNGHGFTITFEDPSVASTSAGEWFLYAVGSNVGVPFDRTQPVFRLTKVADVVTAGGDRAVSFAPEIATANWAFPGNYLVGAGPDRTPNTFGSFTVKVPANAGPKGDKGDRGDTGPAGRNGTNGTNGRNGKDGKTTIVRVQTTSLARAPFKGKKARKVRVTARKSTKTLATGTVKGRSLTITLARGVKKKRLKGTYVLRLAGGKKGSAVVTL